MYWTLELASYLEDAPAEQDALTIGDKVLAKGFSCGLSILGAGDRSSDASNDVAARAVSPVSPVSPTSPHASGRSSAASKRSK